MPYFENLDANLYYEEKGSGKPLIFLHGASWDLNQWKTQVEFFSLNYNVITMDARGHGKSSLPPGKVSPSIFWKDVSALIDHLHIEKATICGLSLGGHTAMQLAINKPEKVEKLILIGAPCSNRFNLYERICVPINRFSVRLMPMNLLAWSISSVLGSTKEAKSYIRKTVSAIPHGQFNRVWKAATTMESSKDLYKIQCPTLILIGDHDKLTNAQQPFIHSSIKNSKLVTICNANHGTNIDNPNQVNNEISTFLNL